jgi:O-antigen ligase
MAIGPGSRQTTYDLGVTEDKPRAAPLGALALLWLLIVSTPDNYHVHSYSVGALLTIFTAMVALLCLATGGVGLYKSRPGYEPTLRTHGPYAPRALTAFAVWAVVSLVLRPTNAGMQNVLVYVTFVTAIIVTARAASAGTAERFLRACCRVNWFVALAYLATVAGSGPGASAVYSARIVALSLALMLAVSSTSSPSRLLPLLTLAAVVLSLSRTAAVVAVVVYFLSFALRGGRVHRVGRVLVLFTVGFAAALGLVLKIAPLRNRFLGGDQAVTYDGRFLNTSGRTQLWSFTWKSAQHHLWFGGGPGSAQNEIVKAFNGAVAHPHNDYLRLLHDFGIVGVTLFALGYLSLMRRTWSRGRRQPAKVHSAAFLALLTVMLCAITDNVLVYPFVMFPLGVLVGLSLATPTEARTGAQDEGTLQEPRNGSAVLPVP